MTEHVWVLGGGVMLGLLVALLWSWGGCTGGHHFPDEPTSVRWKITPYHEKPDKMGVQRVETYECNHEGCYAEETERTFVGDPKHRDAVEQIVEGELVDRPNYEEYDP